MKAYFVFDVESIGLHGEAFAVAGGVYLENGAAQSEFCFACDPAAAKGDEDDRKWVAANVPVLEITHRDPVGIRESFWLEWLKAISRWGAIEMAVECGWPVEARFLAACVDDDLQDRKWKGPLPLHEIASIMTAAGIPPLENYQRTPSETPAHNPLCDARQSARLLAESLAKLQP